MAQSPVRRRSKEAVSILQHAAVHRRNAHMGRDTLIAGRQQQGASWQRVTQSEGSLSCKGMNLQHTLSTLWVMLPKAHACCRAQLALQLQWLGAGNMLARPLTGDIAGS